MPPPRAPLWTSDEIVAACGPLVTGRPLAAPFVASGLSIDTRTLAPGDLFVALQGATHRGETFLDSAFHKGAAGALVMAPTDDPRAIHVHDTTQALSALGKAARNRFTTTQVVGVTGSVGKSGTKEALRHVLSAYGTTHASQASLNNHWGLPLSLARIPPSAAFAVLEMGMNHPGEIAAHTQITRPHVALITRIGQAHTGHFPHLQAIADAKGEIFLGVPLDGTAVLNRDDPFFEHLFQKAQNL